MNGRLRGGLSMVIAARCLSGILIAGTALVLTAPARAEEASGRSGPLRLAMLDDVAFGRLSVSDAMPQTPKRLVLAGLQQTLESHCRGDITYGDQAPDRI